MLDNEKTTNGRAGKTDELMAKLLLTGPTSQSDRNG